MDTCNSLTKRSSFRESYFVITQANYQKLQRTVKRKWNKRIFLISNLQIPIHFLLLLFMSHGNEMLVLWLAVNKTSTEITVPFLCLKILSYQKDETSKTDDVVDKPDALFFWDQKIC